MFDHRDLPCFMKDVENIYLKGENWGNDCIDKKLDVLKIRTLVACQKGIDKQGRPRSDCC